MAKVDVINVEGKKVGDITLSDEIFGIEPNEFAVQAVVKNYLANQRQGTQSAKTRAEVRGGGRKPFRQKGTGRPITGRRRSSIRTKAKKLQILTQQEAQETRSQVGSLRKGCRQRADRSRRVQVHRA